MIFVFGEGLESHDIICLLHDFVCWYRFLLKMRRIAV